MDNQTNRNRPRVNAEFERRFKYITSYGGRNTECRDAIVQACKDAGIKCNTHIFYNWLGSFTIMPQYAKNVVFPILEKYEQLQKEEIENAS